MRIIETFDEARQRLVSKLDTYFAELRKYLTDPTVTNASYKPFSDAADGIKTTAEKILELNRTHLEAKT